VVFDHEDLRFPLRQQLDRGPPGVEPALTNVTQGVPSTVPPPASVGDGRNLGQAVEQRSVLDGSHGRERGALVASSAERNTWKLSAEPVALVQVVRQTSGQ
jgi:hypothetical protein